MNYPKAKIRDKRALKKWCLAHKVTLLHGYRTLVPRNGPVCQGQLAIMQVKANIRKTGKFDEATLNIIHPGRKQAQFLKAVVAAYAKMKGSGVGSYWWKQIVTFSGLSGNAARTEYCAATWWFTHKDRCGYNGPEPTNHNYVPTIELFAQSSGILVPFARAKAGMTITFIWSGGRGVGNGDHIGIVKRNFGLVHQIATWEGNTGSPSQVTDCWRWWYNVNSTFDMSKLLR